MILLCPKNIWREPSKWLETTEGRGFLSCRFHHLRPVHKSDRHTDDRLQGPQILSPIRADPTKPNPKSGVVQLEWNLTGSLLLARFGEPPRNDTRASCLYTLISRERTLRRLSIRLSFISRKVRPQIENCPTPLPASAAR